MTTMFRTGFGYDSHRFEPDYRLVLCGTEFDCDYGLVGHSDADAPVHALVDALLGALALGDIGKCFPDTDPQYKNADSIKLLKKIISMREFSEWDIANVDITIKTERPKIAPRSLEMRKNIADSLGIDVSQVSIKGKSNEKMGYIGKCEGLESYATVLLERKDAPWKTK